MASGGDEEPKKLKLYPYWRSSCSWRVRIALNLKGLDYECIPINLFKGENRAPVLRREISSTSIATSGSSEETIELPAVNLICSSTQPYHNLPVIGYIKEKLGPKEMLAWVHHHINSGFEALEKLLGSYAWKYATGGEPFLVDVFLAPQIGTANRFNLDMNSTDGQSEFRLLSELHEAYKEHPAFQNALPGKQPDAPRESRY